MAGVIDTVGSPTGAQCGHAAGPAATAIKTASASPIAQPIRSPQVIQDPMAGFITQYIDKTTGQVMDQSPSALVVAYLRQGLTADGSPKDHPTQPSTTA